jgi:hypothetical protein
MLVQGTGIDREFTANELNAIGERLGEVLLQGGLGLPNSAGLLCFSLATLSFSSPSTSCFNLVPPLAFYPWFVFRDESW